MSPALHDTGRRASGQCGSDWASGSADHSHHCGIHWLWSTTTSATSHGNVRSLSIAQLEVARELCSTVLKLGLASVTQTLAHSLLRVARPWLPLGAQPWPASLREADESAQIAGRLVRRIALLDKGCTQQEEKRQSFHGAGDHPLRHQGWQRTPVTPGTRSLESQFDSQIASRLAPPRPEYKAMSATA